MTEENNVDSRGTRSWATWKRSHVLGGMALSVVASAAALADLASKTIAVGWLSQAPSELAVTPFLSLRLSFNNGISFSLLPATTTEGVLGLVALAMVLVAALIWLAQRASGAAERAGYGLIAGGAVGNIIDRARDGLVTDFLDLHAFGWHWPTFNLADVAITCGVVLLLASAASPMRRERPTGDV